jgi:hypothetical protein
LRIVNGCASGSDRYLRVAIRSSDRFLVECHRRVEVDRFARELHWHRHWSNLVMGAAGLLLSISPRQVDSRSGPRAVTIPMPVTTMRR